MVEWGVGGDAKSDKKEKGKENLKFFYLYASSGEEEVWLGKMSSNVDMKSMSSLKSNKPDFEFEFHHWLALWPSAHSLNFQ